jgi:peptide/nickel transport system substrate-binding protein
MKKNVFVIMSIFMISALIATPAAISAGAPAAAQVDRPLVYGTIGLVVDLDPHFAWDSASIDHQNQVVEGLFAYNLGSKDVEIVPRLALDCGVWTENTTVLTLNLRQGVTFHDGNPFNASAVKWNFDRLNDFILAGETQIAELYEPLAGVYPDTPLLVNKTTVINESIVEFTLNYAYVAFLPLMCFTGSAIISPASVDNASEFLEAGTDLLVGTGPYVHVSTTTEKTVFAAYADYYRGAPAIQDMEWVAYEDTTTASNALLAGDIDLGDVSTDFYDEFEASALISVGAIMKGTVILYMGMNNKIINKNLRQAISYAIDYDYMIDELRDGNAARMISPVPEGIAYHNPDVMPATYNVTYARSILIDAGYTQGLTEDSTDQEWLDMTDDDPIATFNYQYNFGNVFREDLGILVKANCKAIGVKVYMEGLEWSAYLNRLLGDFDGLELYMIGWGPDYNDPSNFINPLFSNTSLSNGAQVNDEWLQNAMMDALMDTDPVTRKDKYYEIQEYIVEDLMPWVFLYVPLSKNVLANTIHGWNRNPMGQLDFFNAGFLGVNTTVDDPQLLINCGFEAPWDYYVAPEVTDPTEKHGKDNR